MRSANGRLAAVGAGALLAATALTACGDTGSLDAASPKASAKSPTTGPSRKAFDPPLRFDWTARVELLNAAQPSTTSGGAARPAVTLVDGTAYVTAEGGLEAVDTQTGETRWTAETKHPADLGGFGNERGAPIVVEAGSERVAYAAWERVVKGKGTAPSRSVIEVLAVDTATGESVWSAEIPPAPSATGLAPDAIGADEILAAQVIGADAESVVVAAHDTTYVVDRASGKVRWKKGDFRAVVLTDGVVAGGAEVGYDEGRLIGYSADTGKRRWSMDDTRWPGSAGPKMLKAERGDQTFLVDPVTGTKRASAGSNWRCLHDARSVILCSTEHSLSDPGIAAFDATTLKELWALPDDSDRTVPTVAGAWHGAVYGQVGQDSSVILDGRTGKDRETEPHAAPFEIDQYGGIVHGGRGPTFQRATG